MKVAYYSPMPPERTGIADYSALLLEALRGRIDVDVARRGKSARGDVALYHVGKSPEAHGWILEALRREPGVVVLHDFVLHHLVAGLTLGRKDGPGYLAAMERDAGIAGRLLGLGVIDGCIPPLWEVRPEDFPLSGEVLDLATGLIVHSHYVEERVRERGFAGPVWHVPHPAWPAPDVEPERIAAIPDRRVREHERVEARAAAARRVRALPLRASECAPVLVGDAAGSASTGHRARGLQDAVVRHDYVDEERLWALMAGADVVASLRSPTMGETSGTAIPRALARQAAARQRRRLVRRAADDAALKVPVDERETDSLAAAMEALADPATRAAMGAAALALADGPHHIARVAEAYVAALEESLGGGAVQDAVLREVSEAAAEVGIQPASPEAATLARALDEVDV